MGRRVFEAELGAAEALGAPSHPHGTPRRGRRGLRRPHDRGAPSKDDVSRARDPCQDHITAETPCIERLVHADEFGSRGYNMALEGGNPLSAVPVGVQDQRNRQSAFWSRRSVSPGRPLQCRFVDHGNPANHPQNPLIRPLVGGEVATPGSEPGHSTRTIATRRFRCVRIPPSYVHDACARHEGGMGGGLPLPRGDHNGVIPRRSSICGTARWSRTPTRSSTAR
jgi:hypothetical protein